MQERYLYEYAVLRVLPKVEREEFINVGIVLFCKKAKYIKVMCHINEQKISVFDKDFDFEFLHSTLAAFESICYGHKNGGHIACLDVPERFRWLTAVRSSSLQTSRPHPGLAIDLDATLRQLFQELVL